MNANRRSKQGGLGPRLLNKVVSTQMAVLNSSVLHHPVGQYSLGNLALLD